MQLTVILFINRSLEDASSMYLNLIISLNREGGEHEHIQIDPSVNEDNKIERLGPGKF